MQDEEIDKIIRDAANQHHPPYDDNAWKKMEQLLDQHLPQKKDRKKPFAFWLLFLLVGGGLFYAFVYPGWNNSKTSADKELAANQQTKPVNTDQHNSGDQNQNNSGQNDQSNMVPVTSNSTSGNIPPVAADDNDGNNATKKSNTTISTSIPGNNTQPSVVAIRPDQNQSNKPIVSNSINNNKNDNGDEFAPVSPRLSVKGKSRTKVKIKYSTPVNDLGDAIVNNATTKQKKKTTAVAEKNDDEQEDDNVTTTTITPSEKKKEPLAAGNALTTYKTADEKKKEEDVAKKENDKKADSLTTTVKNNKPKEEKKKKGFASNFGITASVGGDLSFVKLNAPGKTTFLYGAGLSYSVGKRVLVRTGFYASKKIYTAKPDEYEGGTAYPYLDKIDGDCNVYEIPVTVSYNFGQRKKHNWFVSGGISSLIMKKEDYKYIYKVPGGPSYTFEQSINNENKHLFSVLNLSAGYQYNPSERVSLMAEPFVKLPLNGVGAGKIKLNSAGVMVTATVKPFQRKKK